MYSIIVIIILLQCACAAKVIYELIRYYSLSERSSGYVLVQEGSIYKISPKNKTDDTKGFFRGIVNTLNSDHLSTCKYPSLSSIDDFIDNINALKEERISSYLPIPIFLGLLGTIIGIIIGLNDISTQIEKNMLDEFMTGIRTAMISTATGISITTILHLFFHYSKNSVLKTKRHFLSFIESTDLGDQRELSDLISQISENLKDFNTNFQENINSFGETMVSIKAVSDGQLALANKLEKLELNKIVKDNLKILEKFESVTDNIEKVIKEIEKASSTPTNIMSQLAESYGKLNDKIEETRGNLTNLGTTLENDLNSFYNNFNKTIDENLKKIGESTDLNETIKTAREFVDRLALMTEATNRMSSESNRELLKALNKLITLTEENNRPFFKKIFSKN